MVLPSGIRWPCYLDSFSDSLVREKLVSCEVDLLAVRQTVPVVDADALAVTEGIGHDDLPAQPVLQDQRRRAALAP